MSDEREETGPSPTAQARSGIRSALADALSRGTVVSADDVQDQEEPSLDLAEDEREVMREQRGEAPAERERPAGQSTDTRFKALHRQKVRERAKLDKERADLARERAELQAQRSERSERDELAELKRLARESPEVAARRLGIGVDELNKRVLQEDTPEARIEALEKRLEARESAAKERETAAEKREREAYVRREEATFVEEVARDAETFWALEDLEPRQLLTEAYAVSDEITAYIRHRGGERVATNKEIQHEMQARHAARLEKITQKRGGASPAPRALPPPARPARERPARRTDEPDTTHTPTRGERVKALANALARRRA
jgi:hypothetical protein